MAKQVTKKPAASKKATTKKAPKKKPVAKKGTKKPAASKKADTKKAVAKPVKKAAAPKKAPKKKPVAKEEKKEEVAKIFQVVAVKLDSSGKGASIDRLLLQKLKSLDAWHQEHHLPRKWRISKNGKQLLFE